MSGRNKTNVWLQLHNALNANLYDRAEQIVEQIVDSSQGPIPRPFLEPLLETWLLACAPPFFEKLRPHLASNEAVSAMRLTVGGEAGYAHGSLVLLAAALGKCEHLQYLLDAGWDVNGASPEIYKMMDKRFIMVGDVDLCSESSRLFPESDNAPENSELLGGGWGECDYKWRMGHCTPLAAAILCGQTECVELLLERPGVWIAENEPVNCALLFDGKGDERIHAAQQRVLGIVGSRPLRFAGAVFFCTEERLMQELQRFPYDAAYLGTALERCLRACRGPDEAGTRRAAKNLLLLTDAVPELLDDEKLRGLTLAIIPRLGVKHPLFKRCLEHCGETENVKWLIDFLPKPDIEPVLAALSEHTICVADRDEVDLPVCLPQQLRTIARYVHFPPPRFSGSLSGLSRAVLNCSVHCGNVRVVKWAAKKGWLPEPRRLLLEYIMGSGEDTPALRAAILTLPECGQNDASARAEAEHGRTAGSCEEKERPRSGIR